MRLTKMLSLAALSVALTSAAYARDQISIVGSSTVYPFSTIAAEKFGQSSGFKTPVIESTGSGGGMKLFCAGIGLEHPDITNASRAMKSSEAELCASNGVEFQEFIVGNDGLAFANANTAPHFKVSIAHIAAALLLNFQVAAWRLMPMALLLKTSSRHGIRLTLTLLPAQVPRPLVFQLSRSLS